MISQRYITSKYAKMLLSYVNVAFKKKINTYVCKNIDCRHNTKTIDIDPGVTPFIIGCEKCGVEAHSTFYRDLEPDKEPTIEWYRPSLKETLKLRKKPDEIEHIVHGGLLKRKIIK